MCHTARCLFRGRQVFLLFLMTAKRLTQVAHSPGNLVCTHTSAAIVISVTCPEALERLSAMVFYECEAGTSLLLHKGRLPVYGTPYPSFGLAG